MKKYFITSSGTDIGKTFITSALTYQLHESGYKVHAVKPIISGFEDGERQDTEILLEAQGLRVNQKTITGCSPWRFADAISPDSAAANEGKEIDFAEVARYCSAVGIDSDYAFIEGIGGIMVPINEEKTVLDIITRLKFPVILVVGSYLGSLSHTLTTLEVLKIKNVENVKIVISESEESPMPLETTANTIARYTDHPIMVIARVKSGDYREAPDITSLVL